MEQTLIILKPDAVEKKLVGEILTRFEKKGFEIQALKMIWIDESSAQKHYAEHKDKDFFPGLIEYITSGPVVLVVIAGCDAVTMARKMVGATDPKKASPGTIRGDLALDCQRDDIIKNIIHASDGKESAQKEINHFFSDEEKFESRPKINKQYNPSLTHK